MTETTERCGHNGGTGIGAGHVCVCTGSKGHAPFHGVGHGCSCGALWRDSANTESLEVRDARRSVAEADPGILAAAKALASERGDVWEELNIMRQFQDCWTARTAVSAAYNITFASHRIARVVESTGVSLQTVTEVARELKRG